MLQQKLVAGGPSVGGRPLDKKKLKKMGGRKVLLEFPQQFLSNLTKKRLRHSVRGKMPSHCNENDFGNIS